MSLLPFVFAHPMDVYRPRHHYRSHNPFHELQQFDSLMNSALRSMDNEMAADIRYNDKGDLSLQCQTAGFKPEELSVDIEGDRLTVNGKHVEKKDGESVERHFTRMIRLPKELDQSKIKCELDDRGQLVVSVPRVEQIEAPKQNVPIEMKPKDK
ncbi:Small HSP21-like protein [Aphelenchoides besseyi]|nr:Small HSP21-like protein [Aphelenchoides besseyi]KAI6172502.1 Small HSP21-like protein [Aphelenchoides besseyi]KAI6194921.1 Small HSP21-like protein [Aphelenchoides besseyi]KAI6194945.1 Small HSP21-like protein [Aphelenchoides besseyi]